MKNNPLPAYQVFGLFVESELSLPELIEGDFTPDVSIRFGDVKEQPDLPSVSGISYKSFEDKFLLKVSGVACFLVESGNRIIIDREEGGSDDEIRLFLLGSAFGALIHQRGILPLHGSAIVMDNQALIFSGNSGAGKSTLAAGFLNRGFKLLADDVCVITLNKEGEPIAHPGYPQMKLWGDSLENLGHKPVNLKRIRGNIKKYALPIVTDFCNVPLPVKGIYIINAKTNGKINLKNLTGVAKFNAVNSNTYRLNFLNREGNSIAHFKHIEAISKKCFVKRLERPTKGFYINRLIELIELDIRRNAR
ncbi:MAG TPA: hypothetical protein VIH57_01935 [Bacteroidales bacterium]